MRRLATNRTMQLPFAAIALVFSQCAPSGAASAGDMGRVLLEVNCARCHAIGRSGESPHPQAPPFRELSRRYPVSDLDEALVEGLSSGHRDMPEFVFTPEQASAIIQYLQGIQDRRPSK